MTQGLAYRVLLVFQRKQVPKGGGLAWETLRQEFRALDDFADGIKECIAREWLEEDRSRPLQYFLSERGEAEIRALK